MKQGLPASIIIALLALYTGAAHARGFVAVHAGAATLDAEETCCQEHDKWRSVGPRVGGRVGLSIASDGFVLFDVSTSFQRTIRSAYSDLTLVIPELAVIVGLRDTESGLNVGLGVGLQKLTGRGFDRQLGQQFRVNGSTGPDARLLIGLSRHVNQTMSLGGELQAMYIPLESYAVAFALIFTWNSKA